MENVNYYEKLRANYSTFNATLQLDEQQQKSLNSLLGYTEGSLTSFRAEVEKSKNDIVHSQEFKQKKLTEFRAKNQQTLDNEFSHVQSRLVAAQTALQNATHPAKPKDTTEELLRFMQAKEIRENLEKMSMAKRTEFLLSGAQSGDSGVLRAVETQPVTSSLVPSDVLHRANEVLAAKIAPETFAALNLAKEDLEGAELVKNLTQVELGRIETSI